LKSLPIALKSKRPLTPKNIKELLAGPKALEQSQYNPILRQ
jgi:hypothetical protein